MTKIVTPSKIPVFKKILLVYLFVWCIRVQLFVKGIPKGQYQIG